MPIIIAKSHTYVVQTLCTSNKIHQFIFDGKSGSLVNHVFMVLLKHANCVMCDGLTLVKGTVKNDGQEDSSLTHHYFLDF